MEFFGIEKHIFTIVTSIWFEFLLGKHLSSSFSLFSSHVCHGPVSSLECIILSKYRTQWEKCFSLSGIIISF